MSPTGILVAICSVGLISMEKVAVNVVGSGHCVGTGSLGIVMVIFTVCKNAGIVTSLSVTTVVALTRLLGYGTAIRVGHTGIV